MTTNPPSSTLTAIPRIDRTQLEREGWLLIPGLFPCHDLEGVRASFAAEVERLGRTWHAEGRVPDPLSGVPWDQRFERLRQLVPATHSASWRRCIASEAVFRMCSIPRLSPSCANLLAKSCMPPQPGMVGRARPAISVKRSAGIKMHITLHD